MLRLVLQKFRPVLFCTILLSLCPVEALEAQTQAYAVKEWKSEYFKKKEGGLFVKTIAAGFSSPSTGNFQVTLFGILQQKSFTFSNTQTSPDSFPREIWKMASGKYRVDRIDFLDGAGVKRVWLGRADTPTMILVPRVMLSNLGVWTMSPQGATGLSVKFAMGPNTYTERGPAKDSSVAAVINGFTGSVQQVIGGKQVLEGAETDYSNASTLRASASFTRQIAMYYKIDLFKHNAYSKDVMGAIAAFDLNLRTCYTRALDKSPATKGTLVFQILASTKTGTIRQARRSKGTIDNGPMSDCLVNELSQIPMPVHENMVGEFTFTFDVK